jgi:hypothetical protein
MTSRVRAPSQIDNRVALLVAVAVGNVYSITNPEAVYRTGNGNTIASAGAIAVGDLFRDMGKTVVVVNAAGLAVARYRLVQRVGNADAEGVQEVTMYVKVWDAAGTGVAVARSG